MYSCKIASMLPKHNETSFKDLLGIRSESWLRFEHRRSQPISTLATSSTNDFRRKAHRNPSTKLTSDFCRSLASETRMPFAVVLRQIVKAFVLTRDKLAIPPLSKASSAKAYAADEIVIVTCVVNRRGHRSCTLRTVAPESLALSSKGATTPSN